VLALAAWSSQPREVPTLAALVRATRPLAHANIAPPILFGQALALATTGHFSWTALAVAQAFGIVDHLVIVFTNDYADRDADALNDRPTPFSGGSRVLPEKLIEPRIIRAFAMACAVLLVAISVASSVPSLPWLAFTALALIAAYSLPPLRLSYRGGGELLQGLGVGVVLPLVGIASQRGSIAGSLPLLVPTFVLGVAGNVLTSIPDANADRLANKRSPAARWGDARARLASIALHAAGLVLGTLLLPLPIERTLPILVLGLALLAVSTRVATLAFVVLGGAVESLALLGWSLALVL
jgi:1,4-dihydroxy-2-naphthoate octaprenyltransferase